MKYDVPEIFRTNEEKVFPKKGGAYDRLSFPLLAEIPKGKNKKYDRALYKATRELHEALLPALKKMESFSTSSTKNYLKIVEYLLHSFAHLASNPHRFEYLAVSFNSNDYHEDQTYGHLSYVAMTLVIKALQSNSTTSIIRLNGTFNKEAMTGLRTRFSVPTKFKDWLIERQLAFAEHPYGIKSKPSSVLATDLVSVSTDNHQGGKTINPVQRQLTEREKALIVANNLLRKLKIDFVFPDYRSFEQCWDFDNGQYRLRSMTGNQLYRRFSGQDGSGGRLWGHWIQRCPSHMRQFLTFDRQTVYEGDFSSMQLNLMYSLKGVTPPTGDLYEITDEVPRHWMKSVFTKSIGAENRESAIQAVRAEMHNSKPDLARKAESIFEDFWEYHADVADLLFSGATWQQLQYYESEIALEVIADLASQEICCVPIHDGFIVKERFTEVLLQAMSSAYRSILT